MLRYVKEKIQKYVIKKNSNCVFNVKIALNCFYATFKQWLQEVKSPYTSFSFIILIPNFYGMYIMYSR
jgi:hypothetical protein